MIAFNLLYFLKWILKPVFMELNQEKINKETE